MNDPNSEYDNATIIVRSLSDPKCVKVEIDNNTIAYQIDLELGIELVGDTKVKIQIDDDLDDYSLIEEADNDEKVMEEIDQEVETDYLKE